MAANINYPIGDIAVSPDGSYIACWGSTLYTTGIYLIVYNFDGTNYNYMQGQYDMTPYDNMGDMHNSPPYLFNSLQFLGNNDIYLINPVNPADSGYETAIIYHFKWQEDYCGNRNISRYETGL